MRTWKLGMGLAIAGLTAAGSASAEVPERPTFTKDVLPILQENCIECHRPQPIGTSGMVAPMSLTTYREARPWAKAIARAVSDRYMPPWFASEAHAGTFRNERSMTDDEIATIERWVETGAARGNPEDAPPDLTFEEKEWWLGEPDLIVPLPEPVWVGDEVSDWQPNINVELTEEMLPEDRWIKTIECQPGSEVVHHIVVYTMGRQGGGEGAAAFGQNIGGLAPGAEPSLIQDGYGIKLAKGETLRINMHYHKEPVPGSGVYDQSRLGFHFYEKGAEPIPVNIEPIGLMDFEIPPGYDGWTVGMARTFEKDFTILSYLPHMHVRGIAAEYMAYYPDGRSELLLDVPKYDYNWQLNYEYPEPKTLPAGTRVEVKMKFDNSADNGANPNPESPIRFGLDTTLDEMALGWMYYSWADDTTSSD